VATQENSTVQAVPSIQAAVFTLRPIETHRQGGLGGPDDRGIEDERMAPKSIVRALPFRYHVFKKMEARL
jgi:hypothetical protein